MANQSAKKAKKAGASLNSKLNAWILSINALFILYRICWHFSSFSSAHAWGYGLILLFTYISHNMLVASALEGNKSEYFMDLLIITLFIQAGTMFSDYFWYFYLVIPAFFGYKGIRMLLNYVFTPDATEVYDPTAQKRNEKAERKAQRQQMRMGGRR